jgi:hypothetical protein
MNWIYLAQNRNSWRALVNAVMKLGFHNMQGISWIAEDILAFQEVFCYKELDVFIG